MSSVPKNSFICLLLLGSLQYIGLSYQNNSNLPDIICGSKVDQNLTFYVGRSYTCAESKQLLEISTDILKIPKIKMHLHMGL